MGCAHQMLSGFCDVGIALKKNEWELVVNCRWVEFRQKFGIHQNFFLPEDRIMTLIKHSVVKTTMKNGSYCE